MPKNQKKIARLENPPEREGGARGSSKCRHGLKHTPIWGLFWPQTPIFRCPLEAAPDPPALQGGGHMPRGLVARQKGPAGTHFRPS